MKREEKQAAHRQLGEATCFKRGGEISGPPPPQIQEQGEGRLRHTPCPRLTPGIHPCSAPPHPCPRRLACTDPLRSDCPWGGTSGGNECGLQRVWGACPPAPCQAEGWRGLRSLPKTALCSLLLPFRPKGGGRPHFGWPRGTLVSSDGAAYQFNPIQLSLVTCCNCELVISRQDSLTAVPNAAEGERLPLVPEPVTRQARRRVANVTYPPTQARAESVKDFRLSNALCIFPNYLRRGHCHSHFLDEETEGLRGRRTCPRSGRSAASELGLEPHLHFLTPNASAPEETQSPDNDVEAVLLVSPKLSRTPTAARRVASLTSLGLRSPARPRGVQSPS